MGKKYPETVSELFPPKWLKASDLPGPVTVMIGGTEFEEVYDAREREHMPKLVVWFAGAQKRLIPNKTQCEAIAGIVGSERFCDWAGVTVRLMPGLARNNKPTIVIRPAEAEERVVRSAMDEVEAVAAQAAG